MLKLFFISVLLVFSSSNGLAFNLPDTGQTTCYNAAGAVITCPAPGEPLAQDGSYILHPLSYTDNHDGTVTDNNTGLMWQQEDDGIWYDCWYQAAGLYNADCNYGDPIIDVCGSLDLGGHSDWRLPNKRELVSILRYMKSTISSPMADSVFTNVKSPAYWSATSSAQSADRVWQVLFLNGVTQTTEKLPNPSHLATYVRCVRGYEISPAYLGLLGGYVTDLTTGLMWDAGASPSPLTWEQALSYCKDSMYDFTDWRLPNIKELESIVDDDRYSPAIDPAFFDTIGATGDSYWASTTYAYPGFQSNAYIMNTVNGQTLSDSKTDPPYPRFAKCVRGGESGFLWRLLSVGVTGAGTLTSNPSGINCASCSAPFQAGSVVTLYPQPFPPTFVFSGWTGDCPPSGQVTMDADKTCIAAFPACSNNWARVAGTEYPVLTGAGSAYSAAEDDDIIELRGFSRSISAIDFNLDKRVTLSGGRDCSYAQLQSGYSYLSGGAITVSGGAVTFDKIVIM